MNFFFNEYSGFFEKWIFALDFYKVNNFLNKYFGFSFPTLKKVVAKCLKLIWNHSGIISGAYFSPFQGVYYLYRGLRRAPKSYFGVILEYWIIDIENNYFDTDDDKSNNVSHLANDMIFAAAEDCGFSNKSHSACFTHWQYH